MKHLWAWHFSVWRGQSLSLRRVIGRIGSYPPPRPRLTRSRGAGSRTGCGILALLVVAFGACKPERQDARSSVPRNVSPSTTALRRLTEPPHSPVMDPQAPLAQSAPRAVTAVYDFKIRPTEPSRVHSTELPPLEPTPESLHDQMSRCLVLQAEPDPHTRPENALVVYLRVTARNLCDVSFAGSDVWFEVRAVPGRGEGTAARETGRFQDTVPARGRGETQIALRVDSEQFHRFETKLWWAAGSGRKANQ